MKEEYKKQLLKAKINKKRIAHTVKLLRKMRKGDVDKKIHQLHKNAFEKINCLECANCCKTTGPLFTQKDIARLAGHLNISELVFIEKYLRLDEDDDYVLQSVPCPFLAAPTERPNDDNYCTIYEVRPKACREYPHTDRVNQIGLLTLTLKNAQVCPAVADIFEQIGN